MTFNMMPLFSMKHCKTACTTNNDRLIISSLSFDYYFIMYTDDHSALTVSCFANQAVSFQPPTEEEWLVRDENLNKNTWINFLYLILQETANLLVILRQHDDPFGARLGSTATMWNWRQQCSAAKVSSQTVVSLSHSNWRSNQSCVEWICWCTPHIFSFSSSVVIDVFDYVNVYKCQRNIITRYSGYFYLIKGEIQL